MVSDVKSVFAECFVNKSGESLFKRVLETLVSRWKSVARNGRNNNNTQQYTTAHDANMHAIIVRNSNENQKFSFRWIKRHYIPVSLIHTHFHDCGCTFLRLSGSNFPAHLWKLFPSVGYLLTRREVHFTASSVYRGISLAVKRNAASFLHWFTTVCQRVLNLAQNAKQTVDIRSLYPTTYYLKTNFISIRETRSTAILVTEEIYLFNERASSDYRGSTVQSAGKKDG